MTLPEKKLAGVGVVVGRFQTPHLHKGHRHVLDVANQHHKLLILVGVHRAPGSFRNELDFETRYHMLRSDYPNAMIMPIQDEKRDDYWSQKLDGIIATICPLSEATLYHGRLSFAPHYGGKIRLVDVGGNIDDDATYYREQCYEKAHDSVDFRAGQFYYSKQIYPRINPCIDVAITKEVDGELFVCLGRRDSDPDHWRFPGGHVDRADNNMEHTVRREAMEETNVEIADIQYVCSHMVDDWRDTRTNGTLTTLFHAKYVFGALKGGDDIAEAKWFSVKNLENVPLVGEHKKLLSALLEYFGKAKV